MGLNLKNSPEWKDDSLSYINRATTKMNITDCIFEFNLKYNNLFNYCQNCLKCLQINNKGE